MLNIENVVSHERKGKGDAVWYNINNACGLENEKMITIKMRRTL